MGRILGAWLSLACMSAAGCTLVSLDALQSGQGGSPEASTNATVSVASSSQSSSLASTTSLASSTANGSASAASSSAGGCADAFCMGLSGLAACGDFDTATTGIDADWGTHISLNGATTGTISLDTNEGFSCPNSARVDMVGSTGDRSWIRLAHTASLGSHSRIDMMGMVKRTGPNGALEGTSIIEVDFPEAGSVTCQLFVKPYDLTTPHAYVFLQTYNSVAGSIQISNKTLVLVQPTAEQWAGLEVDLDWSTSPPAAVVKMQGQSLTLPLTGTCAPKPIDVTPYWGLSYEDRTQTLLIDNLTTRVH